MKIDNRTNLQVVLQHGPSAEISDNTQSGNGSPDVTANDAFTGHTNMNSAYNSSNATQGGEAKFNGSFFPVAKEKEETHGSRFLFADWLGGYVINSKDQEVKNPNFLFKYDKIRGILLLTNDKRSAMDIDKDEVKSFTLYDQGKQPLQFEKVPAVDDKHFMQVLSAGSKYKIYKLTTTKFIKSDMETNGLVSSGNPYDEYADEITYYVLTVKGNNVEKLILKKKAIKQAFSAEGNKVDDFLSKHRAEFDPGVLEVVDPLFFRRGCSRGGLNAVGSCFLEAADAPDVEGVGEAAGGGGVVSGLLVGEQQAGFLLRSLEAGRPYSGSRRMAEAWRVRTSVTWILNSSRSWALAAAPRSLARDFCRDPRWSMAAAAMTPRE